MRTLLFITGITALAYGLWGHDWTTIIAAMVVIVIMPMVDLDVNARSRRQLLDRLWDDDDLSGSA
jgi:hypothetical protein